MMARPMTMAQPPAKPWTNRAAIMIPIVGVRAHMTDAGGHQQDRRDQGPPSATLIGDRSADQLPERHAKEKRGQSELDLGSGRGEVAGDLREGRHVHVCRQWRDGGQEHHCRHQGGGELASP